MSNKKLGFALTCFATIYMASAQVTFCQTVVEATKPVVANGTAVPAHIESIPESFNAGGIAPLGSIADAYNSAAACSEGPNLPCGCQSTWVGRWIDRFKADYAGSPDLFCEPPFGSGIRQQFAAHIDKGSAAQLTLYQFDFVPCDIENGVPLSTLGMIKVQKLIPRISRTHHPLVIESTRHSTRDEARREFLIAWLADRSIFLNADQVVIGAPASRPLSGIEAFGIHEAMLKRASYATSNSQNSNNQVGIPVILPPPAR